ncbi:MFS transporter [Streptomyces sp. NPDC006743]|uniref:MFS transporter n=1 Tax=Streptomyces sp. NPDC006743 TaxID=3154480 RepID=UPI0034529C9C
MSQTAMTPRSPAAPPGARQSRTGQDTARLHAKVARRLVPLLGLLYLVSYLDRSNIAFAGPNGMNEDLGLTASAYGLASGIFFLGYVALEIPSNMALHRFGARRWLVRILLTWGLVAAATTWVVNGTELDIARLLLGVAEAGCLPGIVLYLTYWFPAKARTRLNALFFLSLPLATVLGAPLSSLVIEHADGLFGLAGWRAMFLVEGVPALLLAVLVWKVLPDGPRDAKWLTPRERDTLLAELEPEQGPSDRPQDRPAGRRGGTAVREWLGPRALALGVAYFGLIYGLYALGFFLPTIIAGFAGASGRPFGLLERGLINAVPYAVAAVAMLLWSHRGRRDRGPGVRVAAPTVLGALAVPVALEMHGPLATMAVVTVTAVGTLCAIPAFWSLPTEMLSRRAAPAGIALVNSLGSLSGFAAPYFTGWLKDGTGSTRPGLWLAGALMLLSAVIVLALGRARDTGPAAHAPDVR